MTKLSTPDSASNFARRASLLRAGATLQDRYRIVQELGSGGMGAVYQAVDERLGATVAIKETFSVDDRLRRQFEQEARLLAHLHHPALPRVSDYFTEDGRAFLVMQFISGDDLAQVIAERKEAFPPHQVIAWADQLLDALIYLHRRDRQIIHRDIKPHNLKITEAGKIALLDFGLAKTHAGDHSTTQSSNSLFGYTRRYSPLEQIQDQGTSPQSDIYALGATLYHLLTGTKPPDSLVRASAIANGNSDPLKAANEVNAAVGAEIGALINKAMALNATDRFASAHDFREALRGLGRRAFDLANDPVSQAPASMTQAALAIKAAKTEKRTDPFDSYSILKPEDEVFRLAKPKRGPAVFVAASAIVLITLAASYPSNLASSFARLFDSPRTNVTRPPASATALRQTKSEAPVKTAAVRNTPVTSTVEVSRQPESLKKRTRRNQSKPNSLKPPPISIAP